MNENIFVNTGADSVSSAAAITADAARPRAFRSIVFGGLTVGVLDGLHAVIASLALGGSPVRAFQYITAGIIGRAAFDGGMKTFLVGILIHFFIATTVAAIYYAASIKFPILIRKAVLCGLLYGITVYFVMYFAVMPLSAAPKFSSYSLFMFLKDLIGHALLVGLPLALITRHFSKTKQIIYTNR